MLRQALLIFRGNARRIFFGWLKKRIGFDDPFALHRKFIDEKADWHQLVFHSRAKNFGGLIEHTRNLMKPGDVVLVMFYRVERDGKRQIGKAGVDAVLLIDRHLILFEIVVGNALLQHSNQQIVRKLIAIVEPCGRNGLQSREKVFVGFVKLSDGCERALGKLVVIAIVPKSSGAFGKVAQIGFVLLIENRILSGNAFGHRFDVLSKCRSG